MQATANKCVRVPSTPAVRGLWSWPTDTRLQRISSQGQALATDLRYPFKVQRLLVSAEALALHYELRGT